MATACDYIAPLLFSSAQAISSSRSSRVVPCAVEGVPVHAYSPFGPGREPGHVRAIANFRLDTRGRDHRCDDDSGDWRLVCSSGDGSRLICQRRRLRPKRAITSKETVVRRARNTCRADDVRQAVHAVRLRASDASDHVFQSVTRGYKDRNTAVRLWYYIPVSDSSGGVPMPHISPCHRCCRGIAPMRVVRDVLAALGAGSPCDLGEVARWAARGVTAVAIAAAVLFASLLGVVLGLA